MNLPPGDPVADVDRSRWGAESMARVALLDLPLRRMLASAVPER